MQVISKIQDFILRNFPSIQESEQFYLTGGTALAQFYLHHRKSQDLDFFTVTEELVEPFSRRLEGVLRAKGISVERQRGLHSFVELFVERSGESTLIQLAQDAPFRFEPVKEFPEYPRLKVDSLVDIASNKLLALFGRAALRDFIDLYVLVKKGGFQPNELMENAKRKDPGFDSYWLAVALERIKTFKEEMPEMLWLLEPIPFQELQGFFNEWRETLAKGLEPN
ncbi:MAG: nucleotidyl transferase AbiEii/AbiGii toxin family protein [Candidatus Omnitrophica bacterium]|nr:nucleotidyl transferase AbiEii/AbiGii toxin family protein [Candidatus Omnitrophota bacterium]